MKKNDRVELEKILHKMNYVVNESARYKEVVNNGDFDAYPDDLEEADDDPNKDKTLPPSAPPPPPADQSPTDGSVPGQPLPPDLPAPDNTTPGNTAQDMPPMRGDDPNFSNMPSMGQPLPPMPDQEQDVDVLQNDIIQSNIKAMRDIHNQLTSLNSFVDDLNLKLDSMNKEVEEVKEPSNAEKLMSKKNVSYPYYFNLNDYWKDNWFNKQEENEGIKELEDGTYIANFDDLPVSDDLNDSFNKIT
jgi:hypothetical protein